ncbi:MAG: glucose 1-dehydrogenase [Thermodesulfobacteriota bacterium]|nr:glucose 1-dehydrogenase [Thermodesulfobacteriota bacterium]
MMDILNMFALEDKVAIVTGAGSGIGRAIALGFAEAGARVATVDIHEQDVKETVSSIQSAGGDAISIVADVSKESDAQDMVKTTLKEFDRIDIGVNNAGILGEPTLAHNLKKESWDRVIAVNLTGVFLCSKEEIKVMLEKKKGKIINIASVAGYLGMGGMIMDLPAYPAAKGGVVNLTRELALEYAKSGININAIAPGWFPSKLGNELFAGKEGKEKEAFFEDVSKYTPMGRIGELEELQGVAIFLASRASDYVTGHILTVDGGWSLW